MYCVIALFGSSAKRGFARTRSASAAAHARSRVPAEEDEALEGERSPRHCDIQLNSCYAILYLRFARLSKAILFKWPNPIQRIRMQRMVRKTTDELTVRANDLFAARQL